MTARGRGLRVGALLVLAVLAAPAAPTAQDDVGGLLQALGIQTTSGQLMARSFALPDMKGSPVRLNEHRGRTVMLYFWTTY